MRHAITVATLLLYSCTTPSFALNPELQVAQQLFEHGEEALAQGRGDTALHSFEQILELGAARDFSPGAKQELFLRMAQAHMQEGNLKQALILLGRINRDSLPAHLYIEARLTQARAFARDQQPIRAYEIVHDLRRTVDVREWSAADRAFVAELRTEGEAYFESRIHTADQSFLGADYEAACSAYEEVLRACDAQLYTAVVPGSANWTKVAYRLMQSYYLSGDYTHAVAIAKHVEQSVDIPSKTLNNLVYLKGLSYRQLKSYSHAIETLSDYLSLGDARNLERYGEAVWELGYCYYHSGRPQEAMKCLAPYCEAVEPETPSARLAYTYLARLQLEAGRPCAASKLLRQLVQAVPDSDPLKYEVHYLSGEVAYQQSKYGSAIKHFEQALPKQAVQWSNKARYNLGWSYLKLAEQLPDGADEIDSLLKSAERSFTQILKQSPSDKVWLALAQVHLTRGERLQDRRSFSRVEQLIGNPGQFDHPSSEAAGLLIRAEAAQDTEKKETLYAELCTERYQGSTAQGTAWLYLGRHYENRSDNEQRPELRRRAIACYEQAAHTLKERQASAAAQAVQAQIDAYLKIASRDSLAAALERLSWLLCKEDALRDACPSVDRLWHLRGWTALKLSEEESNPAFLPVAEESYLTLIREHPQSEFGPTALKHLGHIAFHRGDLEQAEAWYLTLTARFPSAPEAAEGWYRAAECAETLGRSADQVRRYRETVFTAHSDSPLAAEARFRCFPYDSYLAGDADALKNLELLERAYPEAPVAVMGLYLRGMHAQQVDELSNATRLLGKARERSRVVLALDLNPDERPTYTDLHYRILVELGRSYLMQAETSTPARRPIALRYAEECFREVLVDYTRGESSVLNASLYVVEAAELGAIEILERQGKVDNAETRLRELTLRLTRRSGPTGYSLARAYQKLAMLERARGAWRDALGHFQDCRQAGGALLSEEELHDIALHQAECLLCLKRPDTALKLLSQVVNEAKSEAARVHAMVLRGKAYKQQGRAQLAQRQFQSAAQHEGEWAAYAQEILLDEFSI